MSAPTPSTPGPSRPQGVSKQQQGYSMADTAARDQEDDNPRANLSAPGPGSAPLSSASAAPNEDGEDEGDDEKMDFNTIQSFVDKIQYLPSSDGTGATARINITIPKRGEKDFEPLQETVNLQEMMLQKSRQALFNALLGVRGGHSKSTSHAIMTPSHPYPRLLIVHGHMFDTMGLTVRYPPPAGSKGKGKTHVELLPEEALYLLERGSLQIWIGPDVLSEEEIASGVGEWSEEDYSVKGAVEMSAMEGFATFIGREGLSWERYQAYAYLKRLGYTVHRSRRFIPAHFLASGSASTATALDRQDPHLPPFRTWWTNIPRWLGQLNGWIRAKFSSVARRITSVGLNLGMGRRGSKEFKTLLDGWTGKTYASIFSHLRIIPTGHDQPLSPRPIDEPLSSIYDPLVSNPYLPFFHVWKPVTNWSKRAWDKGTEEGLASQKPNYFIAAIDARTTPLPSAQQLAEIFDQLPDEPKGPIKRQGPQYQRPLRQQPAKATSNSVASSQKSGLSGLWNRLTWSLTWTRTTPQAFRGPVPNINMGALRNGDRGFVVAVNDSGNTGWVRFGRTGFAEAAVI